MSYKLTIDINLMNEPTALPSIEKLKAWKDEGKIELIEAEPPAGAFRAPEPPKPVPTSRGGRFATWGRVKKVTGSIAFNNVAAVLFPQKNSQKLSMGEVNDVAHLIKHHGSKNELFVTGNLKDFIEEGKRERLKSAFGILALTPDEAVAMLTNLEGWK